MPLYLEQGSEERSLSSQCEVTDIEDLKAQLEDVPPIAT